MLRNKPNALEDATLEELYAEVLGPNEIDDVLVKFDDGDGTSFDVEFVDFEDLRGFNVAGPLPAHTEGVELAQAVDLTAVDAGDAYVLFETDVDDPTVAVSQLGEIAAAMDTSRADIQRAKRRQIETGFWNELAGKVMDRLGVGPRSSSDRRAGASVGRAARRVL